MARAWETMVSEGRRLVTNLDRSQWALGDLALEVEPMGRDGVRTGSTERLWSFAAEVGVSPESLQQYRKVAAAWPASNRLPATSWTVHLVLMSRQELIRPGMTVTEARKAAGISTAWRSNVADRPEDLEEAVAGLSPQRTAAIVREALDKPEVAEQVVADPHTDATLTRARMARDDAARTGVEHRTQQEAPGLHHRSRIYDGLVDMDAAEQRLAAALTRFQEIDLDANDRAMITERTVAVRRMLDAIDSHVTSGQRFDTELAELLEREGGG